MFPLTDRHSHGPGREHTHDRGIEVHRHVRHTGKTYFKLEYSPDGSTLVKCEGHPSVDLGITDDWVYSS